MAYNSNYRSNLVLTGPGPHSIELQSQDAMDLSIECENITGATGDITVTYKPDGFVIPRSPSQDAGVNVIKENSGLALTRLVRPKTLLLMPTSTAPTLQFKVTVVQF